MKKHLPAAICLLFSILLFSVYAYGLSRSFVVDSDFGRDIDEMARIARGHFTLIGPPLSFGGVFTAPYYYYLFAPVLALTGLNVAAVLYANALLYAAAGGYLFIRSRNMGWVKGSLFSACICLNPLVIALARHPGNGFTYLSFFMVYLTCMLFTDIRYPKHVLLLGITAAGMITFHPVSVIPLLPLSYVVYRKAGLRTFLLLYVLPIVFSFLPLAAFEVKHQFVMMKELFVRRSYMSFLTNSSTVYDISGKKNPIENMLFLSGQLQPLLILHPLLLAMSVFYVWPRRKYIGRRDWFIYCSAVGSFLMLAVALRFRYKQHYVYVFGLFLLFAGLFLVIRYGRYALTVLGIVLVVELVYFPTGQYAESARPYRQFDAAVRTAIDKGLIHTGDKMNVFAITDPYMYVPVGHEYRFFLRKYGYEPMTEQEYASSEVLLIFSEDDTVSVKSLSSWEIEQFGKGYLPMAKRYRSGKVAIYVIRKAPLL